MLQACPRKDGVVQPQHQLQIISRESARNEPPTYANLKKAAAADNGLLYCPWLVDRIAAARVPSVTTLNSYRLAIAA